MPEGHAANLVAAGRAEKVDEPARRDNRKTVSKGRTKKVNYDDLDDDELREYAESKGVNTTWNMLRETIIERLEEA
jgi:hypothetical protein